MLSLLFVVVSPCIALFSLRSPTVSRFTLAIYSWLLSCMTSALHKFVSIKKKKVNTDKLRLNNLVNTDKLRLNNLVNTDRLRLNNLMNTDKLTLNNLPVQ